MISRGRYHASSADGTRINWWIRRGLYEAMGSAPDRDTTAARLWAERAEAKKLSDWLAKNRGSH